jgi:hypothetical protein
LMCKTKGLQTFERMAPFIPTEVVIEWQYRTDEMDSSTVPEASKGITQETPPHMQSSDKLSHIMGQTMEKTSPHHHQWEVRGLRQPPIDEIEKRLLSLPKPEEKEGLYKLYWERHGSGAPLPDELNNPVALVEQQQQQRKKRKAKIINTRLGNVAQKSGLGGMLVSTKTPNLQDL